MLILYSVQGIANYMSDDLFQQKLSMLATVSQYWIPMLNPIVSVLTVKKYRLRVLAIFGIGNRVTTPVVPIPQIAITIGGENAFIRSGFTASPVDLPQASF